jgi:polyhydroxybutyrate depolymerase
MAWRKKTVEITAAVLFTLLVSTGVNAAMIMWGPSDEGIKHAIEVDGIRRDYLLHVPDDLPAGDVPLVLVLHGAYGWGDQIARATDFSRKADAEGFIVAYPEGRAPAVPRMWQFWNTGYCCYGAMEAGTDDVGFIDALIDHLVATQPIDARRVYLAGFSNGGMLASDYAAQHGDKVAALAAVASTIGGRADAIGEVRIPEPKLPVPVYEIHGMRDGGVPWDGSPSHRVSAWSPFSVEEAIAFWRAANNNTADPVETAWADGNIALTVWGQGTPGEVRRMLVRDAGHSWPGGDGAPFFSQPTQDADATDLVWEFFEAHHR